MAGARCRVARGQGVASRRATFPGERAWAIRWWRGATTTWRAWHGRVRGGRGGHGGVVASRRGRSQRARVSRPQGKRGGRRGGRGSDGVPGGGSPAGVLTPGAGFAGGVVVSGQKGSGVVAGAVAEATGCRAGVRQRGCRRRARGSRVARSWEGVRRRRGRLAMNARVGGCGRGLPATGVCAGRGRSRPKGEPGVRLPAGVGRVARDCLTYSCYTA